MNKIQWENYQDGDSTPLNASNVISHGFTDNVEQARRYEDLNEAKKQAEWFDLNVEKIIITKEIICKQK